jgi:hypothetical protein
MFLQLPSFLGYKRKRNHKEDEGEIIKKREKNLEYLITKSLLIKMVMKD